MQILTKAAAAEIDELDEVILCCFNVLFVSL